MHAMQYEITLPADYDMGIKVDDFGRPEVQHWTGLEYEEGPAAAAAPRTAVRRKQRIPQPAPLAPVIEEAVRETRRLARLDGVVCLAVDPRHWELLYFTLWEYETPEATGERYEVLHLSAPQRDGLPRGRRW